MAALTKEQATNFSVGVLGFAGQRTPLRHRFQGVEGINQVFKPLWAADGRSFYYPVVDSVRVSLGAFSDFDLVGHVAF